MATGLNQAVVVGRLVEDPQLEYVKLRSGREKPRAKLKLAVDTWVGRHGKRTEFMTLSVWGQLGEAIAERGKPGDYVFAAGWLRGVTGEDVRVGTVIFEASEVGLVSAVVKKKRMEQQDVGRDVLDALGEGTLKDPWTEEPGLSDEEDDDRWV